MSWASGVIDAQRAFDAMLLGQCAAASERDIEQLEILANVSLPLDYRVFLSTVGAEPNSLWVDVAFDLRLAVVVDYYRATLSDWPDTLPDEHLIIGLDRMTNAQISLDLIHGAVVFTYDDEIGERLHDNLPNMLWHHLQRHRVERHRLFAELDLPPRRLAMGVRALEAFARDVGLTVQQGTDSTSWLASGRGCDIVAYQVADVGGWARMGGDDAVVIARLAKRMSEVLGASLRDSNIPSGV